MWVFSGHKEKVRCFEVMRCGMTHSSNTQGKEEARERLTVERYYCLDLGIWFDLLMFSPAQAVSLDKETTHFLNI